MTDLWFLFGAMSVDNGLFNVVKQVNPEFQRIKMIVTEVVGKQEDPPYEKLAAGFLCETDTPRLRVAIRGYLAANFPNPAPVISLYTAAKFCQLVEDSRRPVQLWRCVCKGPRRLFQEQRPRMVPLKRDADRYGSIAHGLPRCRWIRQQ